MFLTQLRFEVASPFGRTDHHYLFALAAAESGIKNLPASPGSDAIGPFKYSTDRWAELVAEYGAPPPPITTTDRSDLAKQIEMAAREAHGDADKIQELLGRTALYDELYVMHALGLKGGKAVLALSIDHPETPVEQALGQGDLSADEVAKLAQGHPQPVKGTLADVLDAAADALTPGFNSANRLDPREIQSEIPPEGRALLDAIAAHESINDRYDVIFGGRTFTDFSRHPNIRVPIPGRPGLVSTAAGRYQFLFSTWTHYQQKLNLPDFSPRSQDIAAWDLAQTDYQMRTHSNLLSDLKNGMLNKIGPALHATWTSLPGGSEQAVSINSFVALYTAKLAKIQAES
jgi:muramidase (phage lysozyme)